MDRYYLHLHECGTVLEDLEGRECASLQEVTDLAIENARDVMMGELRSGRLCLGCFISITNSAREEVGRVNFRDAVAITGL
jgi:hypothetical protein